MDMVYLVIVILGSDSLNGFRIELEEQNTPLLVPCFALFDREMSLPADIVYGIPEEEGQLHESVRSRRNALAKAREESNTTATEAKDIYNHKASLNNDKVGDL